MALLLCGLRPVLIHQGLVEVDDPGRVDGAVAFVDLQVFGAGQALLAVELGDHWLVEFRVILTSFTVLLEELIAHM